MVHDTTNTKMPVTIPAFENRTGKVNIAPPIIEFSSVKMVVMEEFYFLIIFSQKRTKKVFSFWLINTDVLILMFYYFVVCYNIGVLFSLSI